MERMVVSRVAGLNRIAMSGRPYPLTLPNLVGLFLAGPQWCFSDDAGTVPATIGGVVATWKDAGGSATQLNQTVNANRPLLQVAASGRCYLAFDGSNSFFTFSTSFASIPLTAHAAVRLTAPITARASTLVTGPSGAQKYKIHEGSNGGMVAGKEGVTNWTVSTSALTGDTDGVGGLSYGATGAALYWLNGATAGTAFADTSVAGFTANVTRLGANSAGGEQLMGRLYGTAVYAAGLTAAQNAAVQQYLSTLF